MNTELWDEKRLISLLKQGNDAAFRVLVRQYNNRLFGIAYGIVLDREESLEILQEVFLKVFQNIHRFREEAGLSTWLHRITVNQCLNWHRRWKRKFRWQQNTLERDGPIDYPDRGMDNDPEAIYREKELKNKFMENLGQLPREERVVFVLKEVEGLSYDEIARVLKIKRGTVSSRLFYARQRLKESLTRYMD